MAKKHAFVDTACWVGILSRSDQLHRSAQNVYEKLFGEAFRQEVELDRLHFDGSHEGKGFDRSLDSRRTF